MVPQDILDDEAKNEKNKIKQIGKTIDRENLVYRVSEYKDSFKNFRTIKTFGKYIYNGEITLKGANHNQINLLPEVMNFKKKNKTARYRKKIYIYIYIIKNL